MGTRQGQMALVAFARTLEEGTFDMVFFDDRLAMPAVYGDSVADAVRTGARPIKLDL